MIFTHLARIIAILGLLLGVFNAVIGVGAATGSIGEWALNRYGGARTAGQVIDRSIVIILISVAFGALSEIGKAVRRARLD